MQVTLENSHENWAGRTVLEVAYPLVTSTDRHNAQGPALQGRLLTPQDSPASASYSTVHTGREASFRQKAEERVVAILGLA